MVNRLIVLVKEPLPGFVKTRIAAVKGNVFAAALAHKLLQKTLALCESFLASGCSGQRAVHLYVAPDVKSSYWSHCIEQGFILHQQISGDLGARLTQATQPWLEEGDAVVCIGMDCPHLTLEHINSAFAALSNLNCVLQPAQDGGYVLLGLRQWQAGFFDAIDWSTPLVAQQTRERMTLFHWTFTEQIALADIDYVEDIPEQLLNL